MNEPALRYWRGRWVLAEDVDIEAGGCLFRFGVGYVSDLASVPRLLWDLVAPFELGIAAPLLHDFLYGCCGRPPVENVVPCGRTFTRAEVDRLFLEVMAQEGVPAWKRRAAYLAVRFAGWRPWRRYATALAAAA